MLETIRRKRARFGGGTAYRVVVSDAVLFEERNGDVTAPCCRVARAAQEHYNHTHTHPFNGPLSGTTRVSRYQKGKTSLDFTVARDSERQWLQLGHMQVCTLLQTDTTPAPHHSVFTGRMPFLPPNQQCQSTEGQNTAINCSI